MWTWILLLLVILPIPWVAQWIWPHNVKFSEIAIVTAISAVLTLTVYGAGRYAMMADIEMLNGQVLSKERHHGRYERSYECNCKQVCTNSSGHESCYSKCDTCYETHYTVRWFVDTSVQQITIQERDSTSRSVYDDPNPTRYTEIQKGDPVTIPHWYVNYVKAAPDSLFHASRASGVAFANKLPPYPGQVYDIYKLDRAVTVGVPVPDLAEWNRDISKYLGTVGPSKQVNLIVVFVDTADSNYIHALSGNWIGGKKNDVTVVVGTTQYPTIDWVRVLAWTDREEFKVRLVHELEELTTIKRQEFLDVIKTRIDGMYQRKPMSDFKYLEYSFDPPVWVVVLSLVVGVLSAAGTTYYFYTQNIRNTISYRRRKLWSEP